MTTPLVEHAPGWWGPARARGEVLEVSRGGVQGYLRRARRDPKTIQWDDAERVRALTAHLAASRCPSLPRVLDHSPPGDPEPWLVMEHRGDMLLSVSLGPRDVLRLARDLLDALDDLHAAGFLHRDVAPQNVVADARSATLRFCLVDFGHSVPHHDGEAEVTTQIGRGQFLAPELLNPVGPAVVTTGTDVFSWGRVIQHAGLRGGATWEPRDGRSALAERLGFAALGPEGHRMAEALARVEGGVPGQRPGVAAVRGWAEPRVRNRPALGALLTAVTLAHPAQPVVAATHPTEAAAAPPLAEAAPAPVGAVEPPEERIAAVPPPTAPPRGRRVTRSPHPAEAAAPPAPPAPPPPLGRIAFGPLDAARFEDPLLEDESGHRFAVGEVPRGTYRVQIPFRGTATLAPRIIPLTVTVAPDTTTRIGCDPGLGTCSVTARPAEATWGR